MSLAKGSLGINILVCHIIDIGNRKILFQVMTNSFWYCKGAILENSYSFLDILLMMTPTFKVFEI